jgi:hypothetical protein
MELEMDLRDVIENDESFLVYGCRDLSTPKTAKQKAGRQNVLANSRTTQLLLKNPQPQQWKRRKGALSADASHTHISELCSARGH